MSFTYEQEPYAQFSDGGQPLFFRRLVGGNPQPTRVANGVVYIDMTPADPTWIYGYSVVSSYAEDRQSERDAWNYRRAFLAWCYSRMEPRGEPGFVPLSDVQEISREEFEQAAANSWV